jgi:TRAP-type mannitol/chloroaromatic compound transport system permease small subunit
MSDDDVHDHVEDGDPAGSRAPAWLRPLLAYQRGMDRVSNAVGSLSKYLVLAVVAVGFANAVLRYAGRFSGQRLTSNRYLELQWYLYSAVFLLAFAYILQHGINVRVDFWFADRSRRTKAVIDTVGHLVGLLPFTILGIWLTYNPVIRSFGAGPDGSFSTWQVWRIWERSPDPGGLPRAPVKALLLLGLVLLLLQALAEMVKLVSELTGHGHQVERAQEQGPLRVE